MRLVPRKVPGASAMPGRPASWTFACVLPALLGLAGCEKKEESHYESASDAPKVEVIHPEVRKIVRTVGQPSFIEAYERTAIYPKLTAYIDKWIVDIGDKVKKGDVLAKLFVPELVEDLSTKRATAMLDEKKIVLSQQMVVVAEANVKAAEAKLEEDQAILAKYQAEVDRWDSEVKRLDAEVKGNVVAPQILLESTKQLKSSTAARDAARATIKKAEADLLSEQATLGKAKIDVMVAQADLGVATSEVKRLEAWNGYLTLTAPFDGIIFARNANTFDFVLPSTGDPSADPNAPHLSSKGAAPIYIVDRTDTVRIFVDIPEMDANYVKIGSKASIMVRAFRDEPIPGSVTRTSWALNVTSRTLRAEIDLPNPKTQLLPGMYAYAKVIIERDTPRTLPVSALTHSGDQTFCWLEEGGKAHRAEVRTGISDGDFIEITNVKKPKAAPGDDWMAVDGSERVIMGDLTILAEGGKVQVESKKPDDDKASKAPADAPPVPPKSE